MSENAAMSKRRSAGYQPDVLLKPKDLFPDVTHRTMIGGASVPSGNLPVQVDNTGLIAATGGIHDQDAKQPGGVEDQAAPRAVQGGSLPRALVSHASVRGTKAMRNFPAALCYTAGRSQGRLLANFPLTTPLLDAGCAPTLVVDGCRRSAFRR